MDGIAGNTFSAISTQVKVLECKSEQRRSPYKSMLLKGPTIHQQSTSKKKDQLHTANAFKFQPGIKPKPPFSSSQG